ncbi:hypothetical protein ABEB36_004060 [Hypothenemus hampei]|uniref:G-protein coupled receptors family 1 profile domain-containing protein n=1 Tax=Hypothenemus hampei TaxID=57062 RepID=A0ABD1F216_HYPHA
MNFTTELLILNGSFDGENRTTANPLEPETDEMGKLQISLFVLLFLLAVIGNTLIILTLAQNRRMRTVTNLFLLNLAVSDLMLGVLVMPVTLVGSFLRRFIFGEILCKAFQFLSEKHKLEFRHKKYAEYSWALKTLSSLKNI